MACPKNKGMVSIPATEDLSVDFGKSCSKFTKTSVRPTKLSKFAKVENGARAFRLLTITYGMRRADTIRM